MTRSRNDLSIYERQGQRWWDSDDRTFASLRRVNAFHFAQLERWMGEHGHGLRGLQVVDLGCGGGLLAAPVAAAGARVVGIDLSHSSVSCAARHTGSGCVFAVADAARTPMAAGSADLVLLSDVLEHLDPGPVLREAGRLLRPGGLVFVTTINRTLRARILAVTIAEGLGLVPRGTHDPRMFVRPRELAGLGATAGLAITAVAGQSVHPWHTLRDGAIALRAGDSLAVGYSALLRRVATGEVAA